MPKFIDLTGSVFGRLTVDRFASMRNGHAFWECVCTCGGRTITAGSRLRSGMTQSCGCLQRQRTAEARTTHGHTRGRRSTGEYATWQSMISRCTNPNNPAFDRYGGRGIRVCDEWLESFETFLKDVGPRTSPKHSLDREDNDGNYELSNVRWATAEEQSNNQRSNVLLTFRGRTQTLAQWAHEFGMPWDRLWARIKKGWTVDDALTLGRHSRRATARKKEAAA